jgi:hypothetical protein
MKTSIKKTLAVTALGLASSLFAVNSQATVVDVSGSAGVNNGGVLMSVADLTGAVTLSVFSQQLAFVGNTGDLSPFDFVGGIIQPGLTVFSILAGVGAGAIADFNAFDIGLNDAAFGSFDATSAVVVGPRSTNFLDIFVTGLYTPGTLTGTQAGGCATGGDTCAATTASMRWSFNRSGNSVSGSSTFNSPGLTLNVPEPATLGLMGLGLAGFAASRKKKQA